MNVKSAAIVHLDVAKVENPAHLFQLIESAFTVEDWANQLEGVVAREAAVGHQFPMVGVVGVVVALHLHPNPCCVEFARQPFTCAIVGFYFNPKAAVESVVYLWCDGGGSLCCHVGHTLHHALVYILHEAIIAVGNQVCYLPARQSKRKQLLDF